MASFWCQPTVVQTIENFNSKSYWSSQIVNGEYSGQFCLFMPQPENLGISYFCPVFHRILWTNMTLWVLRGFTCKCTQIFVILCTLSPRKTRKKSCQNKAFFAIFCQWLSLFLACFSVLRKIAYATPGGSFRPEYPPLRVFLGGGGIFWIFSYFAKELKFFD